MSATVSTTGELPTTPEASLYSWRAGELERFRIEHRSVTFNEFFSIEYGDALLPQLPTDIYQAPSFRNASGPARVFLRAVNLAIGNHKPQIRDYVLHLFRLLGYEAPRRTSVLEGVFSLMVDRRNKLVKPDMSILDDDDFCLLIQKHQKFASRVYAILQIVAEAIAAFERNQRIRRDNGLRPVGKMLIPAIILRCTIPAFYKIEVTQALVDAVNGGRTPEDTTTSL